jgi:hypothetical protein
MAIVLIVAAIVLFGIVVLLIRKPGGSANAAPGTERFRHAGPGEPRPEKPRNLGLD